MWFQDLFNYDFRRTEMCIIPYGTQEGEISFCAYNTGIGWRQHHREDAHDGHAHQVVRGARPARDLRRQQEVELESTAALADAERRGGGRRRADRPRQAGIAKNAREEKLKARSVSKGAGPAGRDPPDAAYDQKMERLYREHILKEKAQEPVISLQSLKSRKQSTEKVEV